MFTPIIQNNKNNKEFVTRSTAREQKIDEKFSRAQSN